MRRWRLTTSQSLGYLIDGDIGQVTPIPERLHRGLMDGVPMAIKEALGVRQSSPAVVGTCSALHDAEDRGSCLAFQIICTPSFNMQTSANAGCGAVQRLKPSGLASCYRSAQQTCENRQAAC